MRDRILKYSLQSGVLALFCLSATICCNSSQAEEPQSLTKGKFLSARNREYFPTFHIFPLNKAQKYRISNTLLKNLSPNPLKIDKNLFYTIHKYKNPKVTVFSDIGSFNGNTYPKIVPYQGHIKSNSFSASTAVVRQEHHTPIKYMMPVPPIRFGSTLIYNVESKELRVLPDNNADPESK
jgi:hypothetical protein